MLSHLLFIICLIKLYVMGNPRSHVLYTDSNLIDKNKYIIASTNDRDIEIVLQEYPFSGYKWIIVENSCGYRALLTSDYYGSDNKKKSSESSG